MSISIKIKKELAERMLHVNFLTDREKDILKMRLGVGGYSPCTLQEIGDRYGITRERVRQIGASIVRRIMKYMPEEAGIAIGLFAKVWVPRYLIKRQQAARKKAASRRKKSIIRNKFKNLVELITEFSNTGRGKERIDQIFKELRITYRRNKSLFEPYLIEELKQWRRRYMEIKHTGVGRLPVEEERKTEETGTIEGSTDQGEIS